MDKRSNSRTLTLYLHLMLLVESFLQDRYVEGIAHQRRPDSADDVIGGDIGIQHQCAITRLGYKTKARQEL